MVRRDALMIKTRADIVEYYRRRWRNLIPANLMAVYGYVEGYASALGFESDDFWEITRTAVQKHWLLESRDVNSELWMTDLIRIAPARDCQLPMFLSAFDTVRGVEKSNFMIWIPDTEWLDWLNKTQKNRYGGALPEPSKMAIHRTESNRYRMYYLDENSRSFFEIQRNTLESMLSCAKNIWRIEEEFWKRV